MPELTEHAEVEQPAAEIEQEPAEIEQEPAEIEQEAAETARKILAPEHPRPTAAAEVKATADPLADLGAGLVADWPAPVAHFVEATKDRAKAQEQADLGSMDPLQISDKNGHFFNPAFCLVDDDGMPVFTKTGLFDLKRKVKRSQLKKKPLDAAEQQKAPREQIEAQRAVQDAAEIAARVQMNANLLMAGFVQVNSFINSAEVVQSVMGKVLAAVKDENGKEHKFSVYDIHQLSVERVLASCNGGPEVHPMIQLAGVFGFSSLAMFLHSKHEKRRQSFKEMMVILWLRIRGKKRVARVVKPAGEGSTDAK